MTYSVIGGIQKQSLIDAGSENKGEMISLCNTIGLKYHMVSPESHDGIINERFHRYLNKVQRIGAADMNTFEEWAMNTVFAVYAWNGAPVDGTHVQRAFAAVGKHFKFPMDVTAQTLEEARKKNRQRKKTSRGEATLLHIETMFPIFWRQKELLAVLNQERRAHHRELKNTGRTQRSFAIGDIVTVRKQVQSNASEGIPAKLVLRNKGPYRVIEKVSEESYQLQKIPGTSTMLKKKGSKLIKESAFRMHKVPSTIVLHKRVDTPDTRLAGSRQILSHNPLEQQLGLVDFGKYATTPAHMENAFEKIQDIWEEEVETNVDSSDEEEEEEITPQILEAMRLMELHPINPRQTTTEAQEQSEAKLVATRETLPMPLRLKALYHQIAQSEDKLFIIAHQDNEGPTRNWYVTQVDMEETKDKLAKGKGQYHCKWYIPKPTASKMKHLTEYPFWPLIKEFKDETTYGATIPIRPSKVDKVLNTPPYKYAWYQKEVNLAEDGITGPFEFDKDYTIPTQIWNEVIMTAPTMKVNVTNITQKKAPGKAAPNTHKRKRNH